MAWVQWMDVLIAAVFNSSHFQKMYYRLKAMIGKVQIKYLISQEQGANMDKIKYQIYSDEIS